MSRLALYSDSALADSPEIYSFIEYASSLKVSQNRVSRASGVEQRARIQFHNQTCPLCSRSTVEPIELRDGQIGRNGAVIPGTGTLVGFSCCGCGHEWPAG